MMKKGASTDSNDCLIQMRYNKLASGSHKVNFEGLNREVNNCSGLLFSSEGLLHWKQTCSPGDTVAYLQLPLLHNIPYQTSHQEIWTVCLLGDDLAISERPHVLCEISCTSYSRPGWKYKPPPTDREFSFIPKGKMTQCFREDTTDRHRTKMFVYGAPDELPWSHMLLSSSPQDNIHPITWS